MTLRAFLVVFLSSLPLQADPVKLGTASAEPPKAWVSEKPQNRLRSHQFKLKSAEEGFADAEVVVYPQSKPEPEKVFPGWRSQFVVPEAKTADDMGKVTKFTAGPATVHLLDVTGTWKYRERPNDPKSKTEMRDDYRVVWAVVVLKDEAAHVRFSGPSKVVDAHYTGFEKWLKSIN